MINLSQLHGQPAIIGSGIAGLVAALELAPQPVVLITSAGLGQASSSAWAQGGIAAAIGPDDSPVLHLSDTVAASDGLCDIRVASGILAEAEEAIDLLEHHGVVFDRGPDGRYALGQEAAHSRRRILHTDGDSSGAELTRALTQAVLNCPSVTCLTGVSAHRILTADTRVTGVQLRIGDQTQVLHCPQVVLATGGCGGLFQASTNPAGNFGQGIAMAARAGAALRDMEFVQFHPTALDAPIRPLPLISEAVRGEGATLIDQTGARFMADIPGAELAPRDVVARAVERITANGGRAYLDARASLGGSFATRFPAITAACIAQGLDPAVDLIPVRTAAHYHMGGIAVDDRAQSSLPGLFAIGECAATGLHGANRLASNSLLEAVVMARRAAGQIKAQGAPATSPMAGVDEMPDPLPRPDPGALRQIVSRNLNVTRDGAGLHRAIRDLAAMFHAGGAAAEPAFVALSMAVFADLRRESRGGHCRRDYPLKTKTAQSHAMTMAEILAHADTHTQTCHTPHYDGAAE